MEANPMIKNIPFKNLISNQRPFFLYDEKKLISNIAHVRKVMKNMLNIDVSLAFSLKTQPNYKIIQTINQHNVSLDVSSLNELNYALALGFDPERIFVGGVGVTESAIALSLETNVGGLHLNSIDGFEYAFRIKKKVTSNTSLSVRFHPNYLKGTKLGETKEALLARFARSKILDGLHVYVGRESFEQNTVQQLFSDIEEMVAENLFSDSWTLYFGPGLPDLDQSKLEIFKINHRIKDIKIEVGRSIASSCGCYGAPILSVKNFSAEKKTVIIDGGLQHFGSPWVNLRHGPIQMNAVFCNAKGKQKKVSNASAAIYGSLCLWHDCLHPNFSVPEDIQRGDWILVPHMGAYGLTAGVPLFIGETLPLEFYYDGKRYIDVTHHNFGTI